MENIIEEIQSICCSLERLVGLYETNGDPMLLDRLLFQASRLLQLLLYVPSYPTESLTRLVESIGLYNSLTEEFSSDTECPLPYTVQSDIGQGKGRPRYEISQQQLEHLLDIGFSCPKISGLLGVSLRTVRNRMATFGLSVRGLYTSISDSDLDKVVKQVKFSYPNYGYRMLLGHLRSIGIRVTQTRVRESLRRVDQVGVLLRMSCAIQRRSYNVPSPLALWHIDGNHKLIK